MLDASFRVVNRIRPFALVAPGFEVVDGVPVTAAPAGLTLGTGGPAAPFAAVELHDLPRGAAARLGLATPAGDHVLVRWDPDAGRLRIEVRAGDRTRTVARRCRPRADRMSVAFVLCENHVTGLVDAGDGWWPVLSHRVGLLDLRDPTVLGRHRYAWAAGAASTVRAGLFGMAGLRDPHLVQERDGSPYVRDGRVFVTWTCAGMGGFRQAHWSVWSLDPADPAGMRVESMIFSRRGGRVLGDHAGQLVRDGDRWLVAVSSWGDFAPGSIHVRHTSTTADLLRGVHVLDTEPLVLPTTDGTWDPALTRHGGRWVVAFVESPSQAPFRFHPAVAATTSDRWTQDLRLQSRVEGMDHGEGPVLVEEDGQLRLLASDEDRKVYPILDLDGRELGRLDASYGTNIPHPQVLPDPAGGHWLVTFDGTPFGRRRLDYGTHGDVVLMHSSRPAHPGHPPPGPN